MTLLYNHDSFVYRYTNYWYTLDRICNYCTIQRWYKKKIIPPLDEVVSWSVHVLNTNANGIILKKENKSMLKTDEWTNTSNFVNVIFCTLITKQEMSTSIWYNNTRLLVHPRFIALPWNELLTQYFFYMHCLLLLSWIDMRG